MEDVPSTTIDSIGKDCLGKIFSFLELQVCACLIDCFLYRGLSDQRLKPSELPSSTADSLQGVRGLAGLQSMECCGEGASISASVSAGSR